MNLSEINTLTVEGKLLMAAISLEADDEKFLNSPAVPEVLEIILEEMQARAKKIYPDYDSDQQTLASMNEPKTFEQKIATAINQHSIENESNTPDYILAKYLRDCLTAFARASQTREWWYGLQLKPMELASQFNFENYSIKYVDK